MVHTASKGSLVLFCALFMCAMLCAQREGGKELKGRVHSNKDVIGVVVQNITSIRAVITDVDGNFSIPIKLNDTLVFSAVQFKRKVLIINEVLFNTGFISVPLEEFVNQLDEVVVKPYDLTGGLYQDLHDLKLEKDVSAESLGLPNAAVRIITQSENKLHDADHGKFVYFYGVGFAININKILNRLNGKTEMLRKRVQLDKNYEFVKNIEEEYIDSLFTSYLKIPQEQYYDFMYYCQVDTEFSTLIKQEDELKFWAFLVEKSKAYRKNNNME